MKTKKESKNKLPTAPQLTHRFRLIMMTVALVAFTLIVYEPLSDNGFASIDDATYVTNNALVQYPSMAIWSAVVCQHYHPLTIASLALDNYLFGNEAAIYHRTNLWIHLLNGLLVLLFIRRFTKNDYAAFLVAIWFAIHPLHVESVAWISERKDVLYACFFFISLLLYQTYLTTQKWLWWWLTLCSFVLALLSKSQAITLPAILMLMDYWYGKLADKKMWLQKIPFFLLAMLFAFLALHTQQQAINDSLQNNNYWLQPLYVCYALILYVLKLIAPYQLSIFYPYPQNQLLLFAAPLAMMVALWFLYKFRQQKEWIMGSLFFIACLLPVLQLKPVGAALLAERYTYVAAIGLFLPIALWITAKVNQQNKTAIISAVALYSMALGFITHAQVKDWNNNRTLLLSAEKNYPSEFIKITLANWYGNQGKLDSGLLYINAALTTKPNLPILYFTRAHFCGRNFRKGIVDADTTIALDKNYATAYLFKGLLYAQLQHDDSAMLWLRKGIAIAPNADGYLLIGELFEKSGKVDSAQYYFHKALTVDPTNLIAYQKVELSNP